MAPVSPERLDQGSLASQIPWLLLPCWEQNLPSSGEDWAELDDEGGHRLVDEDALSFFSQEVQPREHYPLVLSFLQRLGCRFRCLHNLLLQRSTCLILPTPGPVLWWLLLGWIVSSNMPSESGTTPCCSWWPTDVTLRCLDVVRSTWPTSSPGSGSLAGFGS